MLQFSRVTKLAASRARHFSSRKFSVDALGDKVLYGIIGTNVVVFGAWYQSQSNFTLSRFMRENFLVSYNGVVHSYKLHTLFTSIFSHMDASHLAMNMFTLYFFGTQTIAYLGARAFLSLYLGGGLTASCCHVLWPKVAPESWAYRLGRSMYAPALGASGAVSAVVAWAICNAPTSVVYVYMVLPVPAALFGVFFLGSEFLDLYGGNTLSGNAAHLGGAAFGASYFLLKNSRRLLRR